MVRESEMKSDIRLGERVRLWNSFHAVWQRGTVIGLHVDSIGIDASGDEYATVRFDESAGTGVTDVAVKRHRLECIVEESARPCPYNGMELSCECEVCSE